MSEPTVAVHIRLAESTKQLADVCARNKRMSAAAFYKLAIEEAVHKYRPKHKVAPPEFVETEDFNEALLQDLDRMGLLDET